MVLFLTSSPTGPLDNSRVVEGLDNMNNFAENLKKYWKADSKVLYMTATPLDTALNDEILAGMKELFTKEGLAYSAFDVCDVRMGDIVKSVLHSYDVIIIGGGHVPTQNRYFAGLTLRDKMIGYDGMVIGISAGAINATDVVYSQPELEGEAVEKFYVKFCKGLNLTKIKVLPHYQMTKDKVIDGMKLFEDITYKDSMTHEFIAIPDGSYILGDNGVETVYGEAYMIKDGVLTQICKEGETYQF